MSRTPEEPRRFTVDASLILQLGETLIRDDIQAIMELVKNSYDADATTVRLVIDANTVFEGATSPGYIAIVDDGHGMDSNQITNGWLTISNSLKREMKRLGRTSASGRTPLGDKGLGRLSAQRLGRKLLIETVPDNGSRLYRLQIDWANFKESRPLETVAIGYEDVERGDAKVGTRLVVTELLDVDRWREMSSDHLRVRLAEIVSPYDTIENFRLRCRLNGKRIDPDVVTRNVRSAAHLRYVLGFDGQDLFADGYVRPEYIAANLKNDELLIFRETVEVDRGERFLKFLAGKKKELLFDLRQSESGPWMFRTSFRRKADDIRGIRIGPNAVAGNPGPFSGEIDAFNLGNETARDFNREFDVFSRASEFKKFVSLMSGIRVYRDGFAIRVDDDWLGLGRRWTTGGSWYTLKPSNTLGYISISAKDNPLLEETTDREGFVDSVAYQSFHQLLQEFLKYTADSQEQLRRGWNDFKRHVYEEVAHVRISSPLTVAASVEKGLGEVELLNTAINESVSELKEAVSVAEREIAAPALPFTDSKTHAILEAVSRSVSRLEDAMSALGSLEERRAGLKLLANEVEALRSALAETYELVSLGLTTETLSHEISQITSRLYELTANVEAHVIGIGLSDAVVRTYIEQVKDALSGLEKQMSHLDPALKYVRERKFDILMPAFVKEVQSFFSIRFAGEPIKLEISEVGNAFVVRMNKGKLIQIFDNLILNSEYWVKQDIRAGVLEAGRITLRTEAPYVFVSDNGPGIDPTYVQSIFDMFVTSKPSGEGRGLGLFIVTQLLDADGCAISLLPETNARGRRFKFRIDFSGVLTPG